MIKRLISFLLTLIFLVALPLEAEYRYNPYTRKLDYYEPGAATLGAIPDVTLTGLATGNVLYYDGAAWVNLATGANAEILTLAAGIPSWAAVGAPAAHAASHEVAGADLVDHDQLTGYLAAQHLTLPAGIAAVLTDHNLLAHTALGLFDASGDVDHDLTTNYLAAQHLTLPSTIVAVLTDHTQAAHNALLIDADTVDGEHAAAIVTNARVKVHFPDTIANILSDHNLLAHTALGLFDASADVDHDATTNWVANKHIDWTAAASNFSTSEDFTLAWTEAADHATITQTAVAGIANIPLINIDDDRTGVTADTVGEATIVMNTAGTYAFYVQTGAVQFDASFEVLNVLSYDYTTDHNLLLGYLAGQDLTAGQGQYNTLLGEQAGTDITTGDDNVIVGFQAGFKLNTEVMNVYIGKEVAYETSSGDENVVIGWQAGYGTVTSAYSTTTIVGTWAGYALTTGNTNNIFGAYAASELTGGADNSVFGSEAMYNNQTGNYNVVIGNQAGMGVVNNSYSNNVIVGNSAAQAITTGSNNVILGYWAVNNLTSGAGNVVIGYMAGEGWLDTEDDKLVIDNSDTATPLIYGDFSADNITINGDFNVTMDAALDQIVFAQSAVAGTEDQPLIFIDDDRTGATVDEASEATLYIDTNANRAIRIGGGTYGIELDGNAGIDVDGSIVSRGWFAFSSSSTQHWQARYDDNGGEDDLQLWKFVPGANDSAGIFYSLLDPTGMTDHNDYLSPTFILTNDEGADANDYAGVVIGERTQADVAIAHYFDFYAMVGSADGSADGTTTEIAAIFRFGANGTGVPDNATTPGDVLMEGNLEVDGDIWVDGGDIKSLQGQIDISTSAPDSALQVNFYGNHAAIGTASINLYDEGQDEALTLTCMAGFGQILTTGVAPGPLWIMGALNADIVFWPAASASNPWFYQYGGMGGPQAYLRMQVDSSGDSIVEPQNDLSILKGDGVYSLTVNFDDADPTALCTVADGYVITDCWIEVTTAWDGNGYIEVGDGGNDDGFMASTNYDDSTPGYYGHDITDRGLYLLNGLQHIYTGADTIDIKVNTGTSTQGVATVYVHITRLK